MTDSGDIERFGEVRAAGDRALLVIPPLRAMVAELVSALRPRPAGVVDVLPAADTVLVILESPHAADTVRKQLRALLVRFDAAARVTVGDRGLPGRRPDGHPVVDPRGDGFRGEPVVIPVRYDGEDLPRVARLLGLTEAEVVAQHTGTVWRCSFVGFAPGFGYLESPDGRMIVPRRTQSRTAIPAGAVALAGGYSAVYPRRSPGGWQLIGTTDVPMWDVDREPPALVRAGTRVRFVEAGTDT
ncbi:5-oxoprolinase subunit B family protein [Nocardia aurantiaca]|uniref:Carboxyltransferase domain-containing protein n=1 Tax=Nocardia aurantiaca TaxID=2675850 RepID=A0A6I3KWP3_9NOCA|nr:allophanate hydrolase subunit 1 [Nocardia aurantiaca]MTE11899.1 carboxyltransferase domain-containing protein [Nocardia aurantiaca]